MRKWLTVLLLVFVLFSVVAPPSAFADSGRDCDEEGNCICYSYGWTFDPWCLCWTPYYYEWEC